MSKSRSALVIVDVQRDFCPGGALAAPSGDRILPIINDYIEEAGEAGMAIYASRDWHPAVTKHFKPFGGEWPPHCIQGTPGAAFHPDLKLPTDAIVISKGDDTERPGYSAFEGRTPQEKMFLDDLRDRQIDSLYVTGLTTEYCVKQTVLDALRSGLRVTVLSDAVGAIDAHPGDADRALAEMSRAGATIASGAALSSLVSR